MTPSGDPRLLQHLLSARTEVARVVPALADERWESTPEEVGLWLLSAQAAAIAGDYVPRPQLGEPKATTLYIEATDDGAKGDLYAICFGPPVPSAPDEFESLVGDELGDLVDHQFELEGMAATQKWCSQNRPEADREQVGAVDAFVRFALFDIIDRGLATASAFSLRLVVRRHEEPTLCLWERDEAGTRRAAILQVA